MFKQCLSVMYREITYMWRDRDLRYLLLIGPLLGLFLFYATYSAQVIKDIPTAIVCLDRSDTARQLVKDMKNAEYLKVVAYPSNYQELEELIKEGRVVVGIVIPENLGRQVALHRRTNIFVTVDGSNMIYATNAASAVMAVTRTVSSRAGINALISRGINFNQAREAYQGVNIREEPWFNPTLNYAYFLVLALALNIWQQCCMLAASINVIGETGRRSWYQIKASGISVLKLFFSKSIVQVAMFMLLVLPVYVIAFVILHIPIHCNFGLLLLFTLVFALALHSIGTLASSLAHSVVDSTRLGMLIALPSFILSGYTWPMESMPHYLQQAVKILPQTWFFQGINYLTFKNPGPAFIGHYFLMLSLVTVACYGAAALITLRK
ncbi:ABC-2 type transport system permease protein [Desulfotomaculum arcticum]|uniref:ABC-2 type transport system permease protein n=1 Tax=Desulfotruncus arcticus DSM 17038 TaxID=1121424 RepID=A0A1I2PJJ3_9FIRM|nr:ABC transporter permease [Desulfotruncus arcticus]SFG15603.1 ABC-2 type transport system permease protein [Desulfotomaculum arcticum] [Desulfotruncus arcticus DSM 17038]